MRSGASLQRTRTAIAPGRFFFFGLEYSGYSEYCERMGCLFSRGIAAYPVAQRAVSSGCMFFLHPSAAPETPE